LVASRLTDTTSWVDVVPRIAVAAEPPLEPPEPEPEPEPDDPPLPEELAPLDAPEAAAPEAPPPLRAAPPPEPEPVAPDPVVPDPAVPDPAAPDLLFCSSTVSAFSSASRIAAADGVPAFDFGFEDFFVSVAVFTSQPGGGDGELPRLACTGWLAACAAWLVGVLHAVAGAVDPG
jgi:hypothetical protein